MLSTEKESVLITGVGVVTPMGSDFPEFGRRVMAGQSGIKTITTFDTSHQRCCIGGLIDSVPCPASYDPAAFSQRTPGEQLLLACAVQALEDSGWWNRRGDVRIGLVLGVGAEWILTWESDVSRGGRRISEPHSEPAGYAQFLHEQLGLGGPFSTVAAACASGNVALGLARQWLRQGWVDVVLAGAGERPISPMGLGAFGNLGALSSRNDQPMAASRPFDRDRDGFVMAEGAALFVLEPGRTARDRGAKVYGEVAGFGATSDAFHLVAPSDDHRHAVQAMRLSLRDARVNADDLDYVNAHATSTPVGDVFEARALRDVLGDAIRTVPVSATKSTTGHLVGAASAIEAAICLAAFAHQAAPPTINLEHPDPECAVCHVANEAQPRRLDIVLSNSFGFGGSNACLVLKRAA